MAGGNKIKPVFVPLSDRTYITGYAELMGYLGIKSKDLLVREYIEKGLRPIIYGRMNRWRRDVVDKFIEDHDEYQEVIVRPGRSKKQAQAD